MRSKLHLPARMRAQDVHPVHVTPESAGWLYTGLDVVRLGAGERRLIETRARELVVLPLAGACTIEVAGTSVDLRGRKNVFSAVSDFLYVGAGESFSLVSRHGGEFALPWARATRSLPAAYGESEKVRIEVRGAGRATREIRNFFTGDVLEAERLVAVEVLTPPGNWSSWPPHKHDDASSGEDELEEIYYFRIEGEDGFGVHRTYTRDGDLDETVVVRDGDVFLVPRGYHGPCIAAPEFALYYLNVLAGPGTTRTLRFSDDPAYSWIRESWKPQPRDPRGPMTRPSNGEAVA